MSVSKPFITHGSESAAFWQIGILWQMMATGALTGGKLVLIDQVLQLSGAGPTTHTHVQDEGLYVVEGKVTFNAGGKSGIVARAGTFVAVPGLTEHSFKVEEPNSRLLNFYLPAGFEMLLMGTARPAERREPPPPNLIHEWLPPRWVTSKLNDDYGVRNKFSDPLVDPPNPDYMSTEPTPGATVFPFAANISDARRHNVFHGNALWGRLASSQETGASYSLFELKLRRGALHGPRVFTKRDVMVFVLSGNMSFFLSDCSQTAKEGALVWIPRATVHSIRTDSDTAACLYLQTPGGFENYIDFVGTPTSKTSPPSPDFEDRSVAHRGKEYLYESLGMQDVAVLDPLKLSA
ncbi:uncharacterized protein PV06_11607 [Exophiala oligosperma]|uniref:Cupin type-2 domain-containing protein n=1 Tax=Exophiala oligosperma TaxID=215243 RepID=A0A0D2DK53_9EURO|nr:uncharacterized protein PV06_11607 [Exophiala oligosperma]KIW36094.1 hypothetical protein PV06_11607 [Exophiala oligosperma]